MRCFSGNFTQVSFFFFWLRNHHALINTYMILKQRVFPCFRRRLYDVSGNRIKDLHHCVLYHHRRPLLPFAYCTLYSRQYEPMLSDFCLHKIRACGWVECFVLDFCGFDSISIRFDSI